LEKGPIVGHGARADVYAWGEGKVLKLFWEGTDPRGVAGEAEATKLIHDAGLPVPDCFGTVTVDGRPGIVFERINGPNMRDIVLTRPWLAAGLARQTAELHAAMHEITVPEIYPAQRQSLERRIQTATQLDEATRAEVLRTLSRLPDGNSLCHGDLHPGNILLAQGGSVVIDWQDPSRGRAVADVARTVLLLRGGVWHMTGRLRRAAAVVLTRVFETVYLRRYAELRPLRRDELQAWLPVLAAARLREEIREEAQWLVGMANTVSSGSYKAT